MNDIEILKINDKTYVIYQNVNNKREQLIITIPDIQSPFGLEEFSGVTYINIVPNAILLKELYKIEDFFEEQSKKINKNIEWYSCIKQSRNFKPLWKIRLFKRKDKYNIKCLIDNIEVTKSEFDFKAICLMSISLHSIWIKNNKAGLIWYLDEVSRTK